MENKYTTLLDLIKQSVDCIEYEFNKNGKELEISYRPDLSYSTILNFIDVYIMYKTFIDFDRGYTEKQVFSTDNELIIRLMLGNAKLLAIREKEAFEKEKIITFISLLDELQKSEFKSYKLLVEEYIVASEDQDSRFVITIEFDDKEKQDIFNSVSEYIYKKKCTILILILSIVHFVFRRNRFINIIQLYIIIMIVIIKIKI